jgi:hypothetical protein
MPDNAASYPSQILGIFAAIVTPPLAVTAELLSNINNSNNTTTSCFFFVSRHDRCEFKLALSSKLSSPPVSGRLY